MVIRLASRIPGETLSPPDSSFFAEDFLRCDALPDSVGCRFTPFTIMTTPTTVDAVPTGAEQTLRAIPDATIARTATTPGATVALLNVPPEPSPGDLALLTDEECARAARFAFVRDRTAFVTTRAALRRALGGALQCAPDAVTIVRASSGRPMLDQSHGSRLDFNVSHSGAVAAIALSHTGRVGVDIETHDTRRGLRELVPTVMGLRERDMLTALTDEALFCEAFYGCWTRKEAIVKGIGTGIAADLTAIDLPAVPSDAVVVVPGATHPRWRIATVRVSAGVTMSVALSGCAGTIRIAPLPGSA
jgi:4'-phosphopantetheinyl transferase